MGILVAVPVTVMVLVAGIAGGRWARSRRTDERSIEAHRSTLGTIEHAAGAEDASRKVQAVARAHVRIVGRPAVQPPRPIGDGEVMPSRLQPGGAGRLSFPRRRSPVVEPPARSASR